MAALVEHACEYFASLNPLAKKICQEQELIRKSCGDSWSNLSREEQDNVYNKHFIGEDVESQYRGGSQSDEYPSSFPKLLVNSGEKIVVDFDKDCWTWRDEHSSPFSWETRSQQDLNIWDEDDEGFGGEQESVHGSTSIPPTPHQHGRTGSTADDPDDSALGFRPERSIWESPFLAADRGLDAGYHSSPASDQSSQSTKSGEGGDDSLLRGFALSLHLRSEEGSKLLDSSFEVDDSTATIQSSQPSMSSDSPTSTLHSSSSHLQTKVENVGDSLMSVLTLSYMNNADEEQGHISPVYIEDPGESSTDLTYIEDTDQSSANMYSGLTSADVYSGLTSTDVYSGLTSTDVYSGLTSTDVYSGLTYMEHPGESSSDITYIGLEDPGESSTDLTSEVASSQFSFATTTTETAEDSYSVTDSQTDDRQTDDRQTDDRQTDDRHINSALEEEFTNSALSLLDSWQPSTEQMAGTSEMVVSASVTSLTKTGFDFLDDW